MKRWLKKLIDLFRSKPKPEPVPEPVPEPEPVPAVKVHPDHVNWYGRKNRGGDGLYKPWDYEHPERPGRSALWLLPARNATNGQRFLAEHLGKAGGFRDEAGTQHVKWFRWPGGSFECSNKTLDGNNPAQGVSPGDGSMYFGDRIKVRGAFAEASGNWFLAWDIYGQLVFRKQIQDRNVRQE